MSRCPQFFCRVHGAVDAPEPRPGSLSAEQRSRVCGVGLGVALALAASGTLLQPDTPERWVPWSALWIAVFPVLSRVGPRSALYCGVLAASFTPFMLIGFAGQGGSLSELSQLSLQVAPLYAAAVVAMLVARLMRALDQRASLAQKLGVYELETRIAQGGMGEVWKARHALLSRPAAIKLIRPQKLSDGREVIDERSKQRFEWEAQITASLQSPHTVELYDFGATEDGTFYYVMELLAGANLDELVRRDGPMPPERVIPILRQVLDSLAEAHARGLVHRDIKPANIIVSRRGLHEDFVKVLDFGLVQAVGRPEHPGYARGESQKLEGTPAFMAPEAITQDAPVDARADLYGLGCVAYWLLTGTMVFDATSTTGMAVKHVIEAPETPSERLGYAIPWQLEQIVMSCLAKDPASRPASALALSELLESIEVRGVSGEYSAPGSIARPAPSSLAS